MKSFLFVNIWLMSHRDRRARLVEFHPKTNLIVGANHTGKSSLIKTLFRTLGASPKGHLRQWDDSTVSLVEFSVSQKRYRVVHQGGYRALFDDQDTLIAASGTHSQWSEDFAQTIGFNLVINDKGLETVPGDPNCFFIPFYIDQDGSWQAGWETFLGIRQYSKPIGAILDYFTGIKPPAYYEVKAQRDQEAKQLEDQRKEHRFLEKAKERFDRALPLTGPKVEPENFDIEIEQLTSEVTHLNQRQEVLRDTTVRQAEIIEGLRLQINLAHKTLNTYEADTAFLRHEPHETLVCPTCGAEHQESFGEILNYAEDARILRDLSTRLQNDLTKSINQYKQTQAELHQLESQYSRIADILSTRRGALVFRQVVDSMGAERAFRAFQDEGSALANEINALLVRIKDLEETLKSFNDRKRSKTILTIFRDAYAAALIKLNLPAIATSSAKLTSRPNISGSAGPRSMLAYYGALWRTCYSQEGAFAVPLVIDSPNQQGQDTFNMPLILEYLSSGLPSQAQIIVGSETETELVFDNKVVLEEPYRLLKESEFPTAQALLDPLVNRMHDAIHAQNQASESQAN